MRRLTLTVTPEQAGRTVRSLLRRELRMADGAIARVKTVPDGICLNGAHARTVDRVAAGDTLTVRIDDKRPGGRFTPVAVPLDILYEDADLLALNKNVVFEVDGWTDEGGWSVMVKGIAERITDEDELARARKAPLLPWIPTVKTIFVRVTPTIGISGRHFVFGPEPKQA